MYDHREGIIEIGKDGAFDLSDVPQVPVLPPTTPSSKTDEKESTDWEIKKERGNKAFSSGNYELAIDCYTLALESPLLAVDDDITSKLAKVNILANRALCFMKRAEECECVCSGFTESSWSPHPTVAQKDDVQSFWRKCNKDCEAALELDPGNAKALYRSSRSQHKLGNHMQAFSAARNAKRISPKSKEIVSWEGWLRALEAEREASTAASASAEKSLLRGDGAQDASGVVEQASLEATAAYLHVLGSTATHTNQASALRKTKLSPLAAQHWHHGPRDATEGALFAACLGVSRAMARRLPEGSSRKESLVKMCQDVAVGAARVAGGGLASLLPSDDPRRSETHQGAEEGDDNSPNGAGLRALRATLSALLSPLNEAKVQNESNGSGVVSAEAAMHAGAAAAFFTALMKGNSPSQATTVAEYCLARGAGLDAGAAKHFTNSLSSASSTATPLAFMPSNSFSGAKEGYVFRSGSEGVGYYIDSGAKDAVEPKTNKTDSRTFEDEALESLLKALPNDEARDSVKNLLKLPKKELKNLPMELQDHVAQLKELHKQHIEFAKQSKNTEKVRQTQNEEKKKESSAQTGVPTHNPRDGPVPSKTLTLEEKLAKRRADEMKWLEEFSEKEEKRRQDLLNNEIAKPIDRVEWEQQEALRLAELTRLKQVEDDARRAVAMQHASELRASSKLSSQPGSAENNLKTDKKRKNKLKKEKRKERSGQFDDIRKLAASASEFQFS